MFPVKSVFISPEGAIKKIAHLQSLKKSKKALARTSASGGETARNWEEIKRTMSGKCAKSAHSCHKQKPFSP